MQIEAGHVILPIEDVLEALGPVRDLAVSGREQRVVVAPESGLAVVGDVDAGAAVGPDDVGNQLDIVGRVDQTNAVASEPISLSRLSKSALFSQTFGSAADFGSAPLPAG